MKKQPKYCFYPTLLDTFTKFLTADAEEFFYQGEDGKWHKNYNETDGTFHYSQDEVDEFLLRELLDKINRKPFEPSEAASKGTVFNEIIDCIVHNRSSLNKDCFIASARDFTDFSKKVFGADVRFDQESNTLVTIDEEALEFLKPYYDVYKKIGVPFIYGTCDNFEFYFDKYFCMHYAEYFKGALSQYYTSAIIDTCYGPVKLYGYVDELIKNKVFDIKTTKSYTFGNYKKYWQRHVYPYCLIESGDCTDIVSFEFSVFQLKGGSSRTQLISGDFYREIYDYDHEQSTELIRQHCERFIEFLEAHRQEITDKKIFGLNG